MPLGPTIAEPAEAAITERLDIRARRAAIRNIADGAGRSRGRRQRDGLVAGGDYRVDRRTGSAEIAVHVHPLNLIRNGADRNAAARADRQGRRRRCGHAVLNAAGAARGNVPRTAYASAADTHKRSIPGVGERSIDAQCGRTCPRGDEQRLSPIVYGASHPHHGEKITAILCVDDCCAPANNRIRLHHIAKDEPIEKTCRTVNAQVRSDGALENRGVKLEIDGRNARGIWHAVDSDGASREVQAVDLDATGNLRGVAGRHRRAGVGELQAGGAGESCRAILAVAAINEVVEAALEHQRPAQSVVAVFIDVVQNKAGRAGTVGAIVGENGGLLHPAGNKQQAAEVQAVYILWNQKQRVGAAEDLRAVHVGKTGGLVRLAFDVHRGVRDPGLVEDDEIVVEMNFDAVRESVGQAAAQIQCGVEGNVTHAVGNVDRAAAGVVRGLNGGFQIHGIVMQDRGA